MVIIFILSFALVFVALILALLGAINVVKFRDKKYLDRLFYGGICALLSGVIGFLPYVYNTQKFSAARYPNFMKDVRSIQKALALQGSYSSDIDGIIGNQTFIAIKNFQKDNDISPANGQIDEQTLKILFVSKNLGTKTLPNGKTFEISQVSWDVFSSQVLGFKNTLKQAGCLKKDKTDGVYRRELIDAITCFQKSSQMETDGELGIDTILKIIEYDLKFFK